MNLNYAFWGHGFCCGAWFFTGCRLSVILIFYKAKLLVYNLDVFLCFYLVFRSLLWNCVLAWR